MSSSTILIICGFNMWVLSQIIHEIITDIICHSDFFFRISKINKIGPMVAGNELGVKVFHTGPTFDFFFVLTFGKKCEKNYFKMNSICKENYSPEIVQY